MSCDIGVYNNTLAAVAAGLTFKMAVTNLLTARCRTVGYEQGRRNKEDSSNNFPLLSLFRMFLGGYGPMTDHETMDRLISCSRNNAENEPYFVMAAFGWGLVASPPAYSTKLLIAFMGFRYLHTFVYLFVRKQPYRALAWAPGIMLNVFVSAQVLMETSGLFRAAFN